MAKARVLDEFEVPNCVKARFVKEGKTYRLEWTGEQNPNSEDWSIFGGGVGQYATEFKREAKAKQAWKALALVIGDEKAFWDWIDVSNEKFPNLPNRREVRTWTTKRSF
jgi:tRNA U38,U39,U40 pseudouridine synthase TruA